MLTGIRRHPLGHERSVAVESRQVGHIGSDWEAEFCRVAGAHLKVIAYTKNHNLGREPYRHRVASVQLGR